MVALGAALLRWLFPDRRLIPTGPSQVRSRAWVLTDQERLDPMADRPTLRRIPVEAWFPTDGPLGPVIVFIHGTKGRRTAYRSWHQELASWGYVVVAADHPPVALWPSFPDGTSAPRSSAWQRLMGLARDPGAFVQDATFVQAHDVVAADVRAVLSDLGARLGRVPDRFMLAGHSFGGGLAVSLCEDLPGCVGAITLDGPPFADPELTLTKPVLAFAAGNTRTAPALDGIWAPLDRVMAQAQFAFQLPHVGHLDLSDLGLLVRRGVIRGVFPDSQVGPRPLEPTLRAVAHVSRAFADLHLGAGGDPAAVARRYADLLVSPEPSMGRGTSGYH